MPARLDLTGNIYGELTVIEMLYNYQNKKRTYCKCLGVDNNEYIIRADALQSGATRNIKGACNIGIVKDITGMKFGLLTALYPTDKRASNGSIIWMCLCDCGNYTEAPVNQLMRMHTTSCGCRHRSKRETFIENYLIECGLQYIPQHTFSDCKNIQGNHTLPFDFYLPDYNICIEYDGSQHVEPCNLFGGEEKFKIQKRNDNIKNKYCRERGINLIRLPHTSTEEEIKNVINDIMRPATITA